MRRFSGCAFRQRGSGAVCSQKYFRKDPNLHRDRTKMRKELSRLGRLTPLTIAGEPVNMLQALHAEMDARSIEAAQEG